MSISIDFGAICS